LRAPRPALAGGIALAIAITPVLTATALASAPTVVVQHGDTLTAIARRHGVSVQRLVELNDLTDPNRIFAGQRLRVGRERSRAPATARSSPRSTVHVVTSGSTLWHLAQRYGVSVSAIVSANRIANPSLIFAGQRLVIPATSSPRQPRPRSADRSPFPPRQARLIVHVVSRGSTLSHIAAQYGVTVSAIVAANRIANPSLIFAGQRVLIPGARPSTRNAAPRPVMSASMAHLVTRRDEIRRVLVNNATRQGVPHALVLAVAWQESGWQQGVVSHAGAIGVMQLMPGTAEWIGDTMLRRPVRAHDARSNIAAGVRLLRHYMDRYDGNRDLVLAAYYQGQRAVDTHGIYPVSRPYIASIKYLERLFGG
jgi:N-acetylmuramoyl-L-alanine amidase